MCLELLLEEFCFMKDLAKVVCGITTLMACSVDSFGMSDPFSFYGKRSQKSSLHRTGHLFHSCLYEIEKKLSQGQESLEDALCKKIKKESQKIKFLPKINDCSEYNPEMSIFRDNFNSWTYKDSFKDLSDLLDRLCLLRRLKRVNSLSREERYDVLDTIFQLELNSDPCYKIAKSLDYELERHHISCRYPYIGSWCVFFIFIKAIDFFGEKGCSLKEIKSEIEKIEGFRLLKEFFERKGGDLEGNKDSMMEFILQFIPQTNKRVIRMGYRF